MERPLGPFTPPEWNETWDWKDRLAYVISLCCFLGLTGYGALSLFSALS